MIPPAIVASTADSAVIAPNRFDESGAARSAHEDLERHRRDARIDHVELLRRRLAEVDDAAVAVGSAIVDADDQRACRCADWSPARAFRSATCDARPSARACRTARPTRSSGPCRTSSPYHALARSNGERPVCRAWRPPHAATSATTTSHRFALEPPTLSACIQVPAAAGLVERGLAQLVTGRPVAELLAHALRRVPCRGCRAGTPRSANVSECSLVWHCGAEALGRVGRIVRGFSSPPSATCFDAGPWHVSHCTSRSACRGARG